MASKTHASAFLHPYQREVEKIKPDTDWVKRTAADILRLRDELGDAWYKSWRIHNKIQVKKLGL